MKRVRDLMTRHVEVARPEMTVQEAAQMLRRLNIGSLPVCEGPSVLGILTDRDIAIRLAAEGRSAATTSVAQIMTPGAHTIREDAALEAAEKKMHDLQLRRLPVVNAQDELVGYLCQAKIARAEDEASSGRVLKGISQPATPRPLEVVAAAGRVKTGQPT